MSKQPAFGDLCVSNRAKCSIGTKQRTSAVRAKSRQMLFMCNDSFQYEKVPQHMPHTKYRLFFIFFI